MLSRCSSAPVGLEAALGVARERSGTQFDPALVELFCERAPDVFEGAGLGNELGGR